MRRLRFAARVAWRDPRLLLDYVRLWRGARNAPVPEETNASEDSGDGEVLDWQDAVERAAPGAAGAEPGNAHAAAQSAVENGSAAWTSMDADASLGELAYAIIRALGPDTVIETGVAHGISSAFVLAALADNAHGELHSIDLPPPKMVENDLVGAAIPTELQARWHYHWGSARRLLPQILERSASRGGRRVFVHDSDHSYEHMRWELETAYKSLQPGDILVCDDANFHAGFADAAAAMGTAGLFVRQPKTGGLTGLILR